MYLWKWQGLPKVLSKGGAEIWRMTLVFGIEEEENYFSDFTPFSWAHSIYQLAMIKHSWKDKQETLSCAYLRCGNNVSHRWGLYFYSSVLFAFFIIRTSHPENLRCFKYGANIHFVARWIYDNTLPQGIYTKSIFLRIFPFTFNTVNYCLLDLIS